MTQVSLSFLLRLALRESFSYPQEIPAEAIPNLLSFIEEEVELAGPYMQAIYDEIKSRIAHRILEQAI